VAEQAFVATFRAHMVADDEVEANLISEGLRETMMDNLDEEDGDFVMVTQVIPFTPENLHSPQEICDVLARDRNILIRTRYKEMWDVAKMLDQTIHALKTGGDQLVGYDYGRFLEIAEAVLKGDNPVE
jgi:hypothetical protein